MRTWKWTSRLLALLVGVAALAFAAGTTLAGEEEDEGTETVEPTVVTRTVTRHMRVVVGPDGTMRVLEETEGADEDAAEAETDEDGHFAIRGLRPGFAEGHVRALRPGEGGVFVEEGVPGDDDDDDDQSEEHVIVVRRDGTSTGTYRVRLVRDADGRMRVIEATESEDAPDVDVELEDGRHIGPSLEFLRDLLGAHGAGAGRMVRAHPAASGSRSPMPTILRWLMDNHPEGDANPLQAWFDGGPHVPLAGLRDALKNDGFDADDLVAWLHAHLGMDGASAHGTPHTGPQHGGLQHGGPQHMWPWQSGPWQSGPWHPGQGHASQGHPGPRQPCTPHGCTPHGSMPRGFGWMPPGPWGGHGGSDGHAQMPGWGWWMGGPHPAPPSPWGPPPGMTGPRSHPASPGWMPWHDGQSWHRQQLPGEGEHGARQGRGMRRGWMRRGQGPAPRSEGRGPFQARRSVRDAMPDLPPAVRDLLRRVIERELAPHPEDDDPVGHAWSEIHLGGPNEAVEEMPPRELAAMLSRLLASNGDDEVRRTIAEALARRLGGNRDGLGLLPGLLAGGEPSACDGCPNRDSCDGTDCDGIECDGGCQGKGEREGCGARGPGCGSCRGSGDAAEKPACGGDCDDADCEGCARATETAPAR